MSRYSKKKAAGRPAYKKLFKELEGDSTSPYSLEEFHTVFLEEMDISEYKPAIKLVGDWDEWVKMKANCLPLSTEVESWIEEVKTKLYSESIATIKVIASGTSNASFSANKFLIESVAGKGKSSKRGKGRPTNSPTYDSSKVIESQASITRDELDRVKSNIHTQ